MYYIGSYAKQQIFPSLLIEPKDIDVVIPGPFDPSRAVPLHEYHVVPPIIYDKIVACSYWAMAGTQYTWKLSHLLWNRNNWNKHAKDLVWYQNHISPDVNHQLLDILIEFWKVKFQDDKSRINHDVPNEGFFDDKTKRLTDLPHDDLHEFFKFGKKPMFNYVKVDHSKAAVDQGLVEELFENDHEGFEKLVREEVYTLMAEREPSPSPALYMKYVQKLITDLSPIWYSLLVLQRLNELTKPCPLFKEGLEKLKNHHQQKEI